MVIGVPTPGHRPSVFVIDDDDDVRAFMRTRLEANNFSVDEADSGEEALRRVDDSIDLVIVDLGLPGIDGFATMRALRADARTAHIAIVAVTAQAMAGDAERAIATGFDEYLTKPIDTRALVPRLTSLLSRLRR